MSTLLEPIDATRAEGRYDRQELITWWDQNKLRNSRVLVVGAGALGNEIAKNLALVGVGRLDIVDMDEVEHSNLARCVLFRDGSEGRPKATIVSDAVRELNPNVEAHAHVLPVQQLGTGFLAEMDLVVAGLDNREARLWLGQACRKLGKTWIDGAIEGLRGLARVFLPEGACYECTLGETDRRILAQRRACSLLSADEMVSGKVPTNATTASLVAAMQVQEAIKILVGREDLLALHNEALVFAGETLETYRVAYTEDEWCPSHDRYAGLVDYGATRATSIGTLVDLAATHSADMIVSVSFEGDHVHKRHCQNCGFAEDLVRLRGALRKGDGTCPDCGGDLGLEAATTVPTRELWDVRLGELGLAHSDVITFASPTDRTHVRVTLRPELNLALEEK